MASVLDRQNVSQRRRSATPAPPGRRRFPTWILVGAVSLATIGGAVLVGVDSSRSVSASVETAPSASPAPASSPRFQLVSHELADGEAVSDVLAAGGLSGAQIASLVSAAKPHVDFSRIRPGIVIHVFRDTRHDRLASVQIALAPARTLLARPTAAGFETELHEIPYETRRVTFQGEVTSTLWESAVDAGMDPNLIAELAEVFAWQIDFSREVQRGDRWRLAVDQKLLADQPAGWGRIEAAQYDPVYRDEPFTGIYFEDGSTHGYFEPDGESLRRLFLRSPVRYSRISSRFSRSRYHPVLKKRRPHRGVDYAAAPGTPVRAVGDGRVLIAGVLGGNGNFVKIRHNSTYQTGYSHLQGFARGIKPGKFVRQGDVIGYVGSTGLATGPHLHFSFYENGRYVDPLGRKFPSADPVPRRLKSHFQDTAHAALDELPEWKRVEVSVK